MPSGERTRMETEQLTGQVASAEAMRATRVGRPSLIGREISKAYGNPRALRDLLLEMRANLATSILESQDKLRHVEAALAALDASPELDEALSRALNW